MSCWTTPSYASPPPDDAETLAALPNALRSLIGQLAGVWLDGALHIRAACHEPPWHALRGAWTGAGSVVERLELEAGAIPFASTTFGDELVLCGHDVVRIVAETGEHRPMGTSIGGFIAEVDRDASRFLRLDPAQRSPAAEWEPLLAFWFEDCGLRPGRIGEVSMRWFAGGPEFDRELRDRFEPLLERAERGELEGWTSTPRGLVATVIVLDQLSRNLRRGDPRAFALDERARALARDALAHGVDQRMRSIEALFLYLTFEHSEQLEDQHRCVALMDALASRAPDAAHAAFAGYPAYARRHLAVIERFGRFPHRNEALGRDPTAEESSYLRSGGDRF